MNNTWQEETNKRERDDFKQISLNQLVLGVVEIMRYNVAECF